MTKKRKNKPDLTTRNARASKRRDDALHDLIERLMIRIEKLERRFSELDEVLTGKITTYTWKPKRRARK